MTADWTINLGPESGEIVAQCDAENVAREKRNIWGRSSTGVGLAWGGGEEEARRAGGVRCLAK